MVSAGQASGRELRQTVARRQVWASSNRWGIPDLIPTQISATLPSRLALSPQDVGAGLLWQYRTATLSAERMRQSFVSFYIEDYRFEVVWSRPMISAKSLFAAELAGIIEPDFSCYTDLPRSVQIWNVYRARWVGRLWQSVGLEVIPCVSWTDEASFEFCLAGIPEGPLSICIECRPRFKDGALLRDGIAQVVERLRPLRVLLYGATDSFAATCPSGPEYVWLPAWSPRLRLKQG